MANAPVFTDYMQVGYATVLPTFMSYTVDMRWKEFRRVVDDAQGNPCDLEFIPFSSPKGDAMLACVVKIAGRNKRGRLWQELLTLRNYMRR